MTERTLVLIGGGGHCASVVDAVESMGNYRLLGVLDPSGEAVCGYPCLGSDDQIPLLAAKSVEFIITLGSLASSRRRRVLAELVVAAGGRFGLVVASTARVSRHAVLGEGSVVLHHALVNANATIGRHCIINSFADVEHDAVVMDFCHLSTHSCVNGGARIGNDCFIGSGTTVFQGVTLASGCVISAGCVVRKNLTAAGIYCGSPLRKR